MKALIERCIEDIKRNSERNGVEGYEVQTPKNPAIIVNYNLDKKVADSYYNFLKQLWPSVYSNIPKADKDSDFETIENHKVRGNQLYVIISTIQIHVLISMKDCNVQELDDFLDQHFHGPEYKIVLHEFLDYESKAKGEKSEANLLECMKSRNKVQYQFIYSNKLLGGAMWLGENELKIIRLAANITAIMTIDTHYFNDNHTYTFSYRLLEKPTRKIVQFTIRRLLDNLCNCPENKELDKNISKQCKLSIQQEVFHKMGSLLFKEEDFKYLPDNDKLQKEKKDVKKGIVTLERNYPVTAMCYKAMITQKANRADSSQIKNIDYSSVLSSELISFYDIVGFLKENRQKNELLKNLENVLIHDRTVRNEGTYSEVLLEYGNQAIQDKITRKIFNNFSIQFMEKVDHACDVYQWLCEYRDSLDLQINAVEKEENLVGYYGRLVDDYFIQHKDWIIEQLTSCSNKEELLEGESGLGIILFELFEKIAVYYKSFEDEIDERVGNDTAKNMFQQISEDEVIELNTCIDWNKLQFKLNRTKTSDVLLLISPDSKLLGLDIADNYEALKLGRQECVERIDFHVLSLKPEVE